MNCCPGIVDRALKYFAAVCYGICTVNKVFMPEAVCWGRHNIARAKSPCNQFQEDVGKLFWCRACVALSIMNALGIFKLCYFEYDGSSIMRKEKIPMFWKASSMMASYVPWGTVFMNSTPARLLKLNNQAPYKTSNRDLSAGQKINVLPFDMCTCTLGSSYPTATSGRKHL